MATEPAVQLVFAYLGQLVAVGGTGAAVAYGLFQWFGKTWLDQQFKKQLENLKHEQQKEIEQVRYQINSQFSRISKIHEKEFEVLPKAWTLLQQAQGSVFQVASAIRRTPDFDHLSESQLRAFATASRLADHQKAELLNAQSKADYYRDAIFWLELSDARKAQHELNNYLVVNSIFMTQDLRQQFREMNQGLGEVLINIEIGRSSRSPELQKAGSDTLSRLSKMFDNIEASLQKRLRYEEA